MSNFATIVHIETFKKVTYYSIQFEEEEETLYEQFLTKHIEIEELQEELLDMIGWIQKIGKEIGANSRYFRHEGATSDAKALPPPAKYIEGGSGRLRLYCMVISKFVVILFNGGVKTTQKAQDCPNVSSYFRLANKITAAINKSFLDKDISLNENGDDIIYDDDFELEI